MYHVCPQDLKQSNKIATSFIICLLQVKQVAAIGGAAIAGVGILALGAALFAMLKEDDHEERRHKWQQQCKQDTGTDLCIVRVISHFILSLFGSGSLWRQSCHTVC